MAEYCFPSLLYVKDNLTKAFDYIYKHIDFEDDFIVFNEAERIIESKDEISIRSLKVLVRKISIEYMREEYRENKYSDKYIGFDVSSQADMLSKMFFNRINSK